MANRMAGVALIVGLAAGAAVAPARAELCGASVPNWAKQGQTVTLSVGGHCTEQGKDGCYWIISPPTSSSYTVTSCSYSLYLGEAGQWQWDLAAYNSLCHQCGDFGTINVDPGCSASCTATAPLTAAVDEVVTFAGTATPGGCTDAISYSWEFGDGESASALSTTHAYDEPGRYAWRLTVRSGSTELCSRSGFVDVNCFKVGSKLRLCAAQGSVADSHWVLDGNPRINGVLAFSDRLMFVPTADRASGPLVTSGELSVDVAAGKVALVKGPSLTFDLDGNAGVLLPAPGNPDRFAPTLGGLPLGLEAGIPIAVGASSVTIQPYSWIGIPDVLDLARLREEVVYPKGGEIVVTKAEVTSGELTPSISFVNVAMKYDPKTRALDVRTGAKIPFSKWLVGESGYSLDAQWGAKASGLNRAKLTIGGIKWNIPLGGYPPAWFVLNDFVGELDHVCDEEGFLIGLGGRGNLCLGPSFATCAAVPGEFFRISDMMLAYQHPFRFILRGGTPQVLGYPMGNAKGVMNFGGPPYGLHVDGALSVANVLQGAAGVGLSLTRLSLLGQVAGSLEVPDFSCQPTSYACRVVKAAVAQTAGGLPARLSNVTADIDGTIAAGSMLFTGGFRGMAAVGPLSLAFQIAIDTTGAAVLFGTNYSNLIGVGTPAPSAAALGAAAERTVTLPAATENVLFGAASTSGALPALSLRTPGGAVVTPANAGTFTGVRHVADAAGGTAAFLVESAAAGSWTLAVDNLATGDVTFVALVPQPPPAAVLTSVVQAGDTVSLAARVTPARAATTATFVFATAPGGAVVEPIASGLTAASGTVAATWSVADLPTGTYWVGVRADDGMNPPVTSFFAQPLVVDRGTLAPPSGLTGSRDGGSVTLRWTPSSSAGARGTTVLYTDAPELPGYPLANSGTTSAGITITGLDPAREYAFVAVAYDSVGTQGAPSAPWATAAAAPPAATALPPGVAIADTVAAGEVRR